MKKVECEPIAEGEEKFTITQESFLYHIMDDIGDRVELEDLCYDVVHSAAVKCNGLLYVYFNSDIIGTGEGSYIGDIDMMEIDISDFFPGDPSQRDIEKQPYIIVTERRPLDQVRDEYSRYSDNVSYLKEDSGRISKTTYDHEKNEQKSAKYVDLIHYWEKKTIEEEVGLDIEVDIEMLETEETEEQKPLVIRRQQVDYYVVCQDYVIREHENFGPLGMYPFADFGWMPRKKSYYAKSEAQDLKPNQKELNKLQGIALLGAYKTGLPNVRIKKDFVKRQQVPVGPGTGIIEDSTPPGQGWGIEYLQPPQIGAYIPHLKEALKSGMKDTSGVHDAWSGKAPSAHLNASAIMALQEAAGVRIRPVQRRYYKMLRKVGKLCYGYMLKYYDEDRMYRVYGMDNQEGTAWFRKSDFEDLDFNVEVSMSSSTPYSKAVIASTLERLLELGAIDGMTYLKNIPREVFPMGADIVESIERQIAEGEEKVKEQQMQIVDAIVTQVIEKAREHNLEITPETLQLMFEMTQQEAEQAKGTV